MLYLGKILMVVVFSHGLAERANMALRQSLAVEAVQKYGGFVFYDWEFVGDKLTPGRQPPAPEWLRQVLGEEFFQEVVEVSLVYGATSDGKRIDVKAVSDDVIPQLLAFSHLKRLYIQKTQATDKAMETAAKLSELEVLMMWDAAVTDAGIARLTGLKHLKNIHVGNAKLTDDSLKHLSSMPHLESISAQGNCFTDKGLAYLQGMTNLKDLVPDLGETDITDQGMTYLKGLTKLARLGLQKTHVTDAGLEQLKGLKSLKELWISQTQITQAAVDRFKIERPDLKMVR